MVASLSKDTTPVRPQPLAPQIVRPTLPSLSNNGRSSIQSEEAISGTLITSGNPLPKFIPNKQAKLWKKLFKAIRLPVSIGMEVYLLGNLSGKFSKRKQVTPQNHLLTSSQWYLYKLHSNFAPY